MIRFLPPPLLSLMLALFPFSDVFAVEVDVFTGEAVVADQGAGERRRALPRALEHVLQKYGGVRELGEVEGMDVALEGASSIMLTFYYRNVEREQADGSVLNELRLVAKFSPPEVEELARTLGLPLWQADRRPTELEQGRPLEARCAQVAVEGERFEQRAHAALVDAARALADADAGHGDVRRGAQRILHHFEPPLELRQRFVPQLGGHRSHVDDVVGTRPLGLPRGG